MDVIKKGRLLIAVGLVAGLAAAGTTLAVTAGASTAGTTYYGCLHSGKLIDVGVAAPACPGAAPPISWNSQGSPGPTGPQGPAGQASVVNAVAASDFANPCPQPPGTNTSSSGGGSQAFLNIPGVPGESKDANHPNQIDVLSWSLGVTGPGAGAGCPASHSPTGQGTSGLQFSVVKYVDKASPNLMLSTGTGAHYPQVTLSERKGGSTSGDYLVYTFTTVFVTSVQWSSGGDAIPKEDVTFNYGGVSISYSPQNADGTLGSAIQTCFSIDLQSSC